MVVYCFLTKLISHKKILLKKEKLETTINCCFSSLNKQRVDFATTRQEQKLLTTKHGKRCRIYDQSKGYEAFKQRCKTEDS
ncbi:hypothetical protein JOD17_003341 [Geomicrobium sediminis]|uniref:Uncharacterized protein n=1 Tax=Geomicrobium sediminis TaxID=1347788 RepID=A0ABS2PFN5_9BACL|nr:hypothetical protein [Geomicrobium sediminis]